MPTLAGREVKSTGYGLMGLTWRPVVATESQYIETLNTALEQGANFWNAGELYGTPTYNSLHVLHNYFSKYPEAADKVVLSMKGGLKSGQLVADGSEENIRRSVDECLRVLDGKKSIDIFECARQDPAVPIEQTIGILAKLIQEGKFKYIGLSEVDAETIRRAHKVHPIAAVEVELSLWSTDILHNGVAKACAELGIPVVAYSPLGSGFLTGTITKTSDIPKGDMRHHFSRFQEDALAANLKLVNEVKAVAAKKNVTPAQIAMAWIKTLDGGPGMPTIIPIPGGTTSDRVIENTKDIGKLSQAEMEEIDAILKDNVLVGGRH